MKKLIALLATLFMLVASPSPSSSNKPPAYLSSIKPLVWQGEEDDKPLPHCTTFCIDGSRHFWVTASHCLNDHTVLVATVDKHKIKIIKLDIDKDMAILNIEIPSTDLQLSPYSPTWGDELKAVGYVSGESFPLIFFGRVSNPKAVPLQFGKEVIIQDMTVGGGASGGPVLNSRDQVVSMNEIAFGASPFSQISSMSGSITYDNFRAFTEGFWRGQE